MSSNPNGAWTFGWEGTLNGSLTLYNTIRESWQWYDKDHHSGDYTPTVWQNHGPPTNGVPTGSLSLHPGWDGSFAVARWTSPVSATVTVTGAFDAGDWGAMSYYISGNGVTLYSWPSDANTEAFSFKRTVVAGDTLDFIVGVNVGGGYWYGNTPVSVTIAVPEPESYALMLAGLGVLGAVARRRKA